MPKATCGISLPCVTVLYSALFVALIVVNFVVKAVVFYNSAEDSLSDRIKALDRSNLQYIHAKLEDSIQETKKLNDVHVRNFQTEVIFWDISAPKSGDTFRRLLHNSISVHTQYQFITFLYQYNHDRKRKLSWGSAGWFHDNAFFYTNTSGHTGVFDSPNGSVNFNNPLYHFVDGDEGDLSAAPWLTPMLESQNGIAWTPVYPYNNEATGVDLYTAYGRRFEHKGKIYSFNLDVNLLYVSKLLAAHKTSDKSVAWVVEASTGAIVGSSEAVVADGVTTGGHPSLYKTLPDGSHALVKAWESDDAVIAEASAWLRTKFGGSFGAVEAGSFELPRREDGSRRLLSTLRFLETGGALEPKHKVDWVLVQVTDPQVYLSGLSDSHRQALLISGLLTGAVVVLLLAGTFLVVRTRRLVYRPLRCEASNEDQDAGMPATTLGSGSSNAA